MTVVIARDATANDHLVYAWPFPLGPEEIEISCGEDEIVVMCPSWLVGDRLGPGRHRWRTPDPTRPVGAYFVSTAPVETSFDVTTSFVIPATQQAATLRAQGSIIVRCVDPGLLIAQFVGLPFDNVNEGLLRSVTRSSERLIARVLTRRTVMAQTVVAVTDPGMTASIIEELIAYNPAAGAVFGVEFVRMTGLYVTTADLGWNTSQLHLSPDGSGNGFGVDVQGSAPRYIPTEPTKQGLGVTSGQISSNTDAVVSGEIGTPPTAPTGPLARLEEITSPGMQPVGSGPLVPPPPPPPTKPEPVENLRSTLKSSAVPPPEKPPESSPAINLNPTPTTPPPIRRSGPHDATQPPPVGMPVTSPPPPRPPITPPASAAAAIGDSRRKGGTLPSVPPPPGGMTPSLASILPRPKPPSEPPATGAPAKPASLAKQASVSGEIGGGGRVIAKEGGATPSDGVPLPVMGIGMGGIGLGVGRTSDPASSITSEDEKAVKGEIVEKLDSGTIVLVSGADGRLVSATIRQEQSGYYELEIGGSGETLWVPRASVVAEK
jgi:hypothetical protein